MPRRRVSSAFGGGEALMQDYCSLVAKVEQLRRDDSSGTVYGAWSHRYRLRPPLEVLRLVEFERRHGIELPEEYRGFLLQVANGGAGPGCDGLWPLTVEKDYGDLLKRPFPFKDLWCPRCSQETLEELQARTEAVELTQGSIGIGSYGCSLVIHLVVSGASRGQIWVDDFGSDNGMWPDGEFCPCFFDSVEGYEEAQGGQRRFTFFEWYENWISRAYDELAGKEV
jgi:SMI1 / KNR4 family (SUKH-1)